MARQQFLHGTDDVQWLKDTHLKGLEYPEFRSFVIHGNEDCPEQLWLYKSVMPMYTTPPIAVFILQDDQTYQRHPDPASFANKL